jgi:hypothetical protein
MVMVTLPAFFAVTLPALLTVASDVLEEATFLIVSPVSLSWRV